MEPNWLSGPLPFDLGIALVENPTALEQYAALDREDKERMILQAAAYTTRSELQAYVRQFANLA